MSKERELLEALKRSSEAESALPGIDPVVADSANAAATSGGSAMHQVLEGSGLDLPSMLGFAGDMASSLAGDPMFYVKAAAVLIVALIILTYSLDMIFGS